MYGGRESIGYRPASFSPSESFVKQTPKVEPKVEPRVEPKVEEIEVNLKGETDDIESGFLTLLHLSSLPISEENDKIVREFLRNTPRETVIKTLEELANYGIIPPLAKETIGGVKGDPREVRLTEKVQVLKRDNADFARIREESKLRRFEKQRKKQAKIDSKLALESRIAGVDSRTQFEGKTFNDLDDFIKQLSSCENHKPSVFAERLFSEKSVTVWKNTVTTLCRKIFELHQPDTQCVNVLGQPTPGQLCYMCGLAMNNDVESMKPSCEHILPIMQAMFFLDLYRSSDVKTEEQMNILKMEYAWTHRCCNLIKNVTSLLETRIDAENYPTWHFSSSNATVLISNIFGPASGHGCNVVRDLVPETERAEWITGRVEKIQTEKINPILEYIRSKGANGGVIAMIGLKNCVNPEKIDKKFLEILAQERDGTLVVPPKNIKTRKYVKVLKVKRKGGNKRTYRNKR